MTTLAGSEIDEKYSGFSIIQADYKKIGEHGIRADVLIPNSVPGGKRPVILRFHGGGLVLGDSLFPLWFPEWALDLAQQKSAIIVSANYRFLPEATGVDILTDIDDFWTWVHSSELAHLLSSHPSSNGSPIELDLDRCLAAGDSAGGLLSVYLGLSHAEDGIRAITGSSPMLNIDPPTVYPSVQSTLLPTPPESFIDEFVGRIQPGTVVTSENPSFANPSERLLFFGAAFGHHRLPEFYTRDYESSTTHHDRIFQLQRLDQPDIKLPKGGIVIVHGEQDDIVAVESSHRFINKVRERFHGQPGEDKVVLHVRPGGHCFDNHVHLAEPWLQDTLKDAVAAWLE
ncbi:Alpha/Beta hydrolase protein [Talaromyces proteolyticus]|uniref:Alpha/Beta hydrolase protein n=1 Tax=Talaromyces proteolyticus TaxID=1131652 RepID=A0AAD4Q6E0_9EURO|nr:Alpha/Beta hydrolase protein [Talaromyces proteolyticus]KAH8705252.1 Alpha/Beta hydrolase protein [Talaromyces proteolyticus]